MHKSVKSINTVIFEGISLLKAHVVSFFSYLTSVPRTFDLDCSILGNMIFSTTVINSLLCIANFHFLRDGRVIAIFLSRCLFENHANEAILFTS